MGIMHPWMALLYWTCCATVALAIILFRRR